MRVIAKILFIFLFLIFGLTNFVDANDFNIEILGKADSIDIDDAELKGMIKDNPCGQAKTLTPMVLIRKV